MIKKILLGILALILLVAIGGGGFVYSKLSAFDSSVAKTYDVPLPAVERSEDPAVLERGKHLVESIGGCAGCHGANLAGGRVEQFGPLGTIKMPNITAGKHGTLAAYSDGELARLIRHGIKRDGKTAIFMPSNEFNWLPPSDVSAIVSYLRTVPPADGEPGSVEIGPLGKFLDRQDAMHFDIARRIDHANLPEAPPPSESAEYGAFVSRLCTGCHGATLSGGPLPGAPPDMAVPLNLTPHESGLAGWSFEDFDKLMRQGMRKNGQKLNPFMPTDMTAKMNETEMKALWAYLQKLPPKPFGGR